MARRRRHEEHENHEAWAIPYGDLVTLLLAFFVVMYSISSVNDGKYRVLSDSLNEAFHGTPRSSQPVNPRALQLQPIEQLLPSSEVNRLIAAGLPTQQAVPIPPARPPLARSAPAAPPTPTAALTPGATVQRASASGSDPALALGATHPLTAANAASDGELNRVADQIGTAMSALIDAGQVHVRRYGNWVAVDISTDILFDSGAARLSRPAVDALQHLAAVLAPWPNAVRVEGHTDDRPIDTAAFPSNWELSAARAASVVRLFMNRGVAPQRLAVLGFGQYRPTMPNTTVGGRNANRRVEVVILGRDAAPEAGL